MEFINEILAYCGIENVTRFYCLIMAIVVWKIIRFAFSRYEQRYLLRMAYEKAVQMQNERFIKIIYLRTERFDNGVRLGDFEMSMLRMLDAGHNPETNMDVWECNLLGELEVVERVANGAAIEPQIIGEKTIIK